MPNPIRLAVAGLVVAGAAALAVGAASQGARSPLERPDPAPDENAAGAVSVRHYDAKGNRPERSWLRVRVRHLERKSEYTLWMDDPSTEGDATTVQFGSLTTNGGGNRNYRIDTKKGGAMPFGATLDALAGLAFEVKDADGAVVLTGTFPDTTP